MAVLRRSTHSTVVLAALGAVLALACTTAPPPEPAPVTTVETTVVEEPAENTVELEDGTYVEIQPGVEDGFTHCCGNSRYMMEVDCSGVMVLRCYERGPKGWQQTYGRHCKKSLPTSCYLHGCDDVCAAHRLRKSNP